MSVKCTEPILCKYSAREDISDFYLQMCEKVKTPGAPRDSKLLFGLWRSHYSKGKQSMFDFGAHEICQWQPAT